MAALADINDLLAEDILLALAQELSGEAAKRNLEAVSLHHRTRASSQFRAAAEHIRDQARAYGLDQVEIREYPADGETMFGTQKSRPAWDVDFAELWELEPDGAGGWRRARRLADWSAMPLTLAQDSLSGAATAGLVDIGAGTREADYDGKDVAGKFVLTSSQPGPVASLAVGRYGAAGIISYAPNQRTAWWKEDERLVRWGHLSSFPEVETFAFMISLGEARRLQERLAAGEEPMFEGRVEARQERGRYSLVSALIPGADRRLRNDEIAFTCHLDHPRPGANDNASGCVAILEAARALQKLIDEGRIQRPARSLRFIWPAEIEGSLIYLNAHPRLARRIKANIHMDMVGGGPATKAVFRVSGGPPSLPHFISDIGHEIGEFVNTHTEIHASGGATQFHLTAPEGGEEPLLAMMEGVSLGSDHQIFNEGSWRIPGIYLHDWPDRYIHTNFDTAANIDPTKLKRAAFIGAATALVLATFGEDDVAETLALLRRNAIARAAQKLKRQEAHPEAGGEIEAAHWTIEAAKLESVAQFAPLGAEQARSYREFLHSLAQATAGEAPAVGGAVRGPVYGRNTEIKGPMSAFGYSYLTDKLGAERAAALGLPRHSAADPDGRIIGGGVFAYEALNLVDGARSVGEIRDYLTGALAPVPYELVEEYLGALEEIGVVTVLN
ncbi:MAG: hypothetical protein Tsb0010_18990 [Parvularculaceae bacterium]